MRKGKILAGAGAGTFECGSALGVPGQRNVSPLENGEADEVCEIATKI